MKSIRKCLGENLKKLRKEKDLTQSELARLCGLSLSFLQNIECGKKWASSETIEVIARQLQVHPSDLFVDQDRVTKNEPESVIHFLCQALGVKLAKFEPTELD